MHGMQTDHFLFVTDATIPGDTNLNIHCLSRVLQVNKAELKKKWVIQLDNTGAGNKTVRLMAFLGMLVQYQVFEEVRNLVPLYIGAYYPLNMQIIVHFLPVGHTHEDIDQVFSRLVRSKFMFNTSLHVELASEISRANIFFFCRTHYDVYHVGLCVGNMAQVERDAVPLRNDVDSW
jgi:hypothetical protein